MIYGYRPSIIDKTHFVLGSASMPTKVIREDGNWFASRPQKELQNTGFETFGCTNFNTLAQVEAYMKEVFKIDCNLSERFLGIMSGTDPALGGNDPQKVYEAIRKYGVIPDSMLSWTPDIRDVNEYYSFKGGDEATCRIEGQRWLEKYAFYHAWVSTDANTEDERLNNLKVALKSSPVSRSVYAWETDNRGVYVARGADNHWSFQWAEDVFSKFEDSYEPTLKDVDQPISMCKMIYIEERNKGGVVVALKLTLWQAVINWLSKQRLLYNWFKQ